LKGKAGALRTITQLGYVQIDTISVVERSHHIVLYCRCPQYTHSMLYDLQARDKKIFEYWAHAASFIPIDDYRYYLRVMKHQPKKGSWLDTWPRQHRRLLEEVRKRIKQEGPCAASDFADVKDRKRGPWWDWKPAKAALEVLFWRGDLMIKERRKFQRVYDLTERVLPEGLNTTEPSEEEEKRFFVERALTALGIATQQDINNYIRVSGRLDTWVKELLDEKKLTQVTVKGLPKSYYIYTRDLNTLESKDKPAPDRIHILSPFDNAIILRDRTAALFGFTYALECYVPKNKRKYGYFCLPILWKHNLVGLIDLKAERDKEIMQVQNLHLEKRYEKSNSFLKPFVCILKRFARFNKCTQVVFNKSVPKHVAKKYAMYA
jgi:uncharacterized protein YcaQ